MLAINPKPQLSLNDRNKSWYSTEISPYTSENSGKYYKFNLFLNISSLKGIKISLFYLVLG